MLTDLDKSIMRHHFLAANPFRTDEEHAELEKLTADLLDRFPDVKLLAPTDRMSLPPWDERTFASN